MYFGLAYKLKKARLIVYTITQFLSSIGPFSEHEWWRIMFSFLFARCILGFVWNKYVSYFINSGHMKYALAWAVAKTVYYYYCFFSKFLNYKAIILCIIYLSMQYLYIYWDLENGFKDFNEICYMKIFGSEKSI